MGIFSKKDTAPAATDFDTPTAAIEDISGDYTLDVAHTRLGFSARHAMVTTVRGSFKEFEGTATIDTAEPAKSKVSLTIKAASVDTGNEKRDAHLKSPDFFDAAKYPTMKFKSTAWKKTGENTFDVTGDLTLKDVTKPVTLKVTLLGFGPGMQGAKLSGWEATTTIDKKQWNVNDPAMLDAALGDDVTISLNIEANDKMK